jgi:beta-1,4-mannosyl-glycoprotein beta-1,4-N-acetylglucosaminyltransferase
MAMPRIFDCFTFFNELDLLEIRLHELAPVVDRFVIAESPVTFTGRP